MHKLAVIASCLVVALSPASAIAEDSLQGAFSLGTGFDYSSGKYGGAQSVDILYVPVTAAYEGDRLTFKLVVPYIRVKGVGNGVIPGLGKLPGLSQAPVTPPVTPPGQNPNPNPAPSSTTVVQTETGLGDVIGSIGYSAYRGDAFMLDVVGKIKFATADETKGLGTGENDFSAQLDGYYSVDNTMLFATVGYKMVGSPSGVNLDNVAFGGVGVAQQFGAANSVGLMVEATQSAMAGGDGPNDATLYWAHKFSEALKMQPYVSAGLSNGSPEFGAGIMLTGTF